MTNLSVIEALSKEQKVVKMEQLFEKFYRQSGAEYLVTGSDDNTLNLYCLGRLDAKASFQKTQNSSKGLSKRSDSEVNFNASKTFKKFNFKDALNEQIKTSESFSLIRRYTGHSKPINHVQFAPNGFLFISASFDKSLRVWNVVQNGCLAVLRGHVADVYR
jgi:WD40 repeat protein